MLLWTSCLQTMNQIFFATTCSTVLQKAEGSGYLAPCQDLLTVRKCLPQLTSIFAGRNGSSRFNKQFQTDGVQADYQKLQSDS